MGRAGTELPIFDLRNISPLLHAHSVLLWVRKIDIAPRPLNVRLGFENGHPICALFEYTP